MRIEEKMVPKSESDNSFYQGTKRWEDAQNVIKYTEKNGGKETTVEIPAGGVKEKIAEREKQIQINKLQSINCIPDSNTIISSSSEISISSQQSSDENLDVEQKQKKSRIPIRSSSNVSSSSNNSSVSLGLFQCSKIPVRKNKLEEVSLEPKVYEINEKNREALLSVDHPFLKNISENKIFEAISFHISDRVRVKNLEDQDIAELKKSHRQAKIFSR